MWSISPHSGNLSFQVSHSSTHSHAQIKWYDAICLILFPQFNLFIMPNEDVEHIQNSTELRKTWVFGKTVQRGGVFVTHFEKKSVKFFLHFAHCNSLATLDKILWVAIKSGVACIGCKCGQCPIHLNGNFLRQISY